MMETDGGGLGRLPGGLLEDFAVSVRVLLVGIVARG